jgi:hypothetical protein
MDRNPTNISAVISDRDIPKQITKSYIFKIPFIVFVDNPASKYM